MIILVGEIVFDMVNEGRFGLEEVIRCCYDCLFVFFFLLLVGIRYGDICLENVVYVILGVR